MGKIIFKKLFDLIDEGKITTYRIRKEKIINEASLQRMRHDQSVSTDTIGKLCQALNCQPSDIMEYIE